MVGRKLICRTDYWIDEDFDNLKILTKGKSYDVIEYVDGSVRVYCDDGDNLLVNLNYFFTIKESRKIKLKEINERKCKKRGSVNL